MQMQDYLPFFQDLLLQYYQFTLENPVYAACLAVAVWLLTAMFYSVRIGFLNRRNRINIKAGLDLQNALTAAQQEMQQLQEEVTVSKEQVEQEVQRTAALNERIAALAGQLRESIVALAAQPDLGQQGLSVGQGLEVEHLWQRYSIAAKQLGENLTAQRKTNVELQQAYGAEMAKLAEKDSQLQAMQTRLDSQKQQVAKLELTVEEQKSQLLQQQESAQQRLSLVEAKHQADLARLAELEQQTQEWAKIKQQKAQPLEQPKAPEVPFVKPEPIKPVEITPVEINPEPAQVATVEPAPQPVKVEPKPKPAVSEVVASEPTIARAESAKQQTAVVTEKATGGVTGKFKSLFAGAKQQMEKLDDMFGLSTPMLQPEEPAETTEVLRQPEPLPEQIPVSTLEVINSEQQSESVVKDSSGGLSGKFKTLFGSPKASPNATAALDQKPTETVSVELEPQPVTVAGDETGTDTGKASGKLKNLFGKFKRIA